jgi:hypothetical protein
MIKTTKPSSGNNTEITKERHKGEISSQITSGVLGEQAF